MAGTTVESVVDLQTSLLASNTAILATLERIRDLLEKIKKNTDK